MYGKIKIGDIVSVSFHNSKFTLLNQAEVLYMPSATGDSWHFKELNTDDIYYISEGCTILKLKDK